MSTINVQQTERWASTLSGAALLAAGARRLKDDRPAQAAVLGAVGTGLIWRGTTGHSRVYALAGIDTAEHGDRTRTRLSGRRGSSVELAVSIDRARSELYREWRRLERMPQFMPQIAAVEAIDHRRSRWTARGPGGVPVKWTAEIINDVPNELIAWRTVGGADMVSAGSVRFASEPGGRGTVVSVKLQYGLPGGKLGAAVATIFGGEPSQVLREGLRRFKQVMEAGEVPTTAGQPRGGR